MTARERQGWLVVLTMSLSFFFVFGGTIGTQGIFFTPLLKYLAVSRARLSLLAIMLSVLASLLAPLWGWAIGRVDARWLVVGGATIVGVAMLAASQAHSYGFLFGATCLAAVGINAATFVPGAAVCSNWFTQRRGLALTLVWFGLSLGAGAMVAVVAWTIAHFGWRWAYVVVAAPILLIVVPMALLYVRSFPPDTAASRRDSNPEELPGLETAEALRARSFWLMGISLFAVNCAASAVFVHSVPYLIQLGYRPQLAAWVSSAMLFFAAATKPFMGMLADRLGPKITMSVILLCVGTGLIGLLNAGPLLFVILFIVAYGIGVGPPVAIMAMLGTEVFGPRRFGALWGLLIVFNALGSAVGPVVTGRIFDLYGHYSPAWIGMAGLLFCVAVMPLLCVSYSERKAPMLGVLEAS